LSLLRHRVPDSRRGGVPPYRIVIGFFVDIFFVTNICKISLNALHVILSLQFGRLSGFYLLLWSVCLLWPNAAHARLTSLCCVVLTFTGPNTSSNTHTHTTIIFGLCHRFGPGNDVASALGRYAAASWLPTTHATHTSHATHAPHATHREGCLCVWTDGPSSNPGSTLCCAR
jgi:hypothetical protein